MISDCCCGSPAPVNIVGSPGLAGAPGPSGAVVLLGTGLIDFLNPAAQAIPIVAANYVVTQVLLVCSLYAPANATFGVFETAGGATPIVSATALPAAIADYTWFNMALAAAALSGQPTITEANLYAIVSVLSNVVPPVGQTTLPATVNIYGYAL